jgi:histone H3/H4
MECQSLFDNFNEQRKDISKFLDSITIVDKIGQKKVEKQKENMKKSYNNLLFKKKIYQKLLDKKFSKKYNKNLIKIIDIHVKRFLQNVIDFMYIIMTYSKRKIVKNLDFITALKCLNKKLH